MSQEKPQEVTVRNHDGGYQMTTPDLKVWVAFGSAQAAADYAADHGFSVEWNIGPVKWDAVNGFVAMLPA